MNNVESLNVNVEKLGSVFSNILYLKPEDRMITPNLNILSDLRAAINAIFDDNMCIECIFTVNTDKQFFGIRVNPAMSTNDAVVILSTDEEVRLNKYQVEFDSRLFNIGLTAMEIVAVTIYEISAMMDNNEIFEKVRYQIDYNAVHNDQILDIRTSVNFGQLIIFAIKDTMYKLSSLIFKDDIDEIVSDPYIQACGLQEELASAKDSISSSISGMGETMRSGKVIILQWMFTMYRNISIHSGIIADTLKEAKLFTGSKLEINEIDKAINAIERINTYTSVQESETNLNKFFEKKNLSSLNEISIFKNLKKNGLRGIENELYEFSMKVKNCTESEDAYLIMRGLNSRIGILEDYIANEELNDYDYKHWTDVCNAYKELRIALSKKKFKEKQYGLFFDYSKLDKLDKKDDEE